MIASLTGTVEYVGLDRLILRVGGVGLLVHTTPATAGHRTASARRSTWPTSLVVREDSLTLFGFATPAEREMFETVQTVSGVGPRLALAMLSVMGPDELRLAISGGDTRALTKIPGIGAKSAERLVLELRDKVGPLGTGAPTAGAPALSDRGGRWLAGPGHRGPRRAGLEREAGRRCRRQGRRPARR